MAQLKDTVITGNLNVTNEVLANSIQTNIIKIPTTSGSTTYGLGTAGQVIKSDGTGAYWAADSAGVTSITVKATSPIAIDSSAAITSTGTRTISHANSGATAGSYGDSSAQTPTYGGTFKVPYLSVNATGHVTSISEHTVKIPASDNTDTKVTSATNHYAPAEDSTAQLSADASGGAAATWNSTQLVTGVDIKRDAKGHVTGVAVDSIKMPANPNTNTTYTLSSGTNDGTLKLTPSSGTAQDNIKVTGWDDLKSLVTNATHFKSGFAATGDGAIDGGSTTLKSVAEKIGDMYVCTTSGTLYGTTFEVGDSIIFKADVAAGTAPTAASIIAIESTVSVTQTLTSGTKIGTVEGVDLYCQTNTDTYRAIQVNGTDKLGTATSTGKVNFANGTNTTVVFTAASGTTPAKIQINATDTNTARATGTATVIAGGSTFTWSAGTAPTLGTAIAADDITSWSAGTTPILGTAIAADDITSWSAGTAPALTSSTYTFYPVTSSTTTAHLIETIGLETFYPVESTTTTATKTTTKTFTASSVKTAGTVPTATVASGVLTLTSGAMPTFSAVTITGVSSNTSVDVPIKAALKTIEGLVDEVTDVAVPILSSSITINGVSTWSAGTIPSLSYTARSIPNVTSVGTLPSLSYTARSIPNVTSAGTVPSLSWSTATAVTGVST